MKRTNTTLWSIAIVVLALAVAAGPAAARTQISSSDPGSPAARRPVAGNRPGQHRVAPGDTGRHGEQRIRVG